ncbi:MAG: cob(I)yrinic acid a,c-diamide adenosyltransferase [Fidelibacterota bacterium]
MRINRVTTKKGDSGTSQLSDGTTLPKWDLHFQCLGDLDELNAALGLVLSAEPPGEIPANIRAIQNDLFNIGGEIAAPDRNGTLFNPNRIADLEAALNKMNAELLPLKEFLLPGGTELQSRLHLARAVCRRGERGLSRYLDQERGMQNWLIYLNRLSDYLFVLSRWVDRGRTSESTWDKPAP